MSNHKKFYKAFWYLEKQGMLECLDIFPVYVNPKTLHVDENESLNTELNIWLEFGRYEPNATMMHRVSVHYWQLDTGGRTFEEAIINALPKAKKYFKEFPESKR